MTMQTEEIGRKDQRPSASAHAPHARVMAGMPRTLRFSLTALLAAVVAGALYLLAVRGDALLSDLAAIAALICG
ncbi:MAG: hypothetical protein KJ587_02040 [Alphaproteobacteria bacterium]|nr:hypothetical protein [Alphaproteobacteria bacterium]